jgi:hypothetical protein
LTNIGASLCTECPVAALGWMFALRNSRCPCQGFAGPMYRITGHYPLIWVATWIARVTVVTAPRRLFGSRPGQTSLG